MGFLDKIFIGIIGLLLISLGAVSTLWQYDRAKIQSLKKESSDRQVQIEKDKGKYIETLTALNKENLAKTQALLDQQVKAKQSYEESLNEIETRYRSATTINKRLSDQIHLLNSQLPKYTTQTISQYATTAGDNLAACSATTTELERLARSYYAAYKQLSDAWPVAQITPTITVVDHQQFSHSYTTPIEIKASPEAIQPMGEK